MLLMPLSPHVGHVGVEPSEISTSQKGDNHSVDPIQTVQVLNSICNMEYDEEPNADSLCGCITC